MVQTNKTRVAVLGTLAEFHQEPIAYDMGALLELVAEVNPDLLCLDMTREQWEQRAFEELPPEYQEALLPLAHQTDIVVVPVAGGQSPPQPVASGWKGRVIAWLRNRIATLQRTAPGPGAINQGWRHDLANHLYGWIRRLSEGDLEKRTRDHTVQLTQSVVELALRDPGSRVLVVVNIQYCHIIRHRLRAYVAIQVSAYQDL